MEAIEAYCAEPKLPMPLVRGSFAAIRGHHAAIDPRRLQTYTHLAPPDLDEPLVWTDAYCPDLDAPVLVPAEAVFFPFLPHDYETRSLFPSGTNGLASGATYLDAVVHGVYEVVERHLLREVLKGLLLLERLHLDGVLDLAELATAATDYRVRVYAARPSSARALPFLACVVTEPATGRSFAGYGCAGSVDVALSRAVSEAWQSAATVASGAREDATHKHGGEDALALPEAQTLRIAEYRRAVVDESFDSVRAEHDFLRRWLAAAGHGPLLVANLTRVGVEVPVVKVLVPGATWAAADRAPESLARGPTSTDVARVRHGVRRRALDGGSEP
jgi:ribosomal protein S12 methylthiotransferase accessory factor